MAGGGNAREHGPDGAAETLEIRRQNEMAAPLGPQDLGHVFQCLKGALDQSPVVQRQGEAALQALEARAGFCSCLAVRELPAAPPAHRPGSTPHTPLRMHPSPCAGDHRQQRRRPLHPLARSNQL